MLLQDGYGINIPQATRIEKGTYFFLPHKTEYTIELSNYLATLCDAQVFVDGETIGTFRIPRTGSVKIERPVNAQRKFIFLDFNSPEAEQAQLQLNQNLGLIKVKFIPEFEIRRAGVSTRDASFGDTRSSRGLSAGGTGLGSYSDQQYVGASHIIKDYNNQVELNIRLVPESNAQEVAIAPLHSKGNPEPPLYQR